jgi:hypothetical protein
MAPSAGSGMSDTPPVVPRRAGGHAADRLREQLQREFGMVPPEESAETTESDTGGADPDAARPGHAGHGGLTPLDPDE